MEGGWKGGGRGVEGGWGKTELIRQDPWLCTSPHRSLQPWITYMDIATVMEVCPFGPTWTLPVVGFTVVVMVVMVVMMMMMMMMMMVVVMVVRH